MSLQYEACTACVWPWQGGGGAFPNIGAGQRVQRDARGCKGCWAPLFTCHGLRAGHAQPTAGRPANSRLELQRRAICAASYSVQRLALQPRLWRRRLARFVRERDDKWCDGAEENGLAIMAIYSSVALAGSGKLFMFASMWAYGHTATWASVWPSIWT